MTNRRRIAHSFTTAVDAATSAGRQGCCRRRRGECGHSPHIREDRAVSKERRLGRGLEALLGRSWEDASETTKTAGGEFGAAASVSAPADDARITRDEHGQVWLDCDAIERNPYQPRQTFGETEIADLADSIRTHGILQPLVVRRAGERFELVAGERRLRAAQA